MLVIRTDERGQTGCVHYRRQKISNMIVNSCHPTIQISSEIKDIPISMQFQTRFAGNRPSLLGSLCNTGSFPEGSHDAKYSQFLIIGQRLNSQKGIDLRKIHLPGQGIAAVGFGAFPDSGGTSGEPC